MRLRWIVLLCLIGVFSNVEAACTLSWTRPTEYTDGSALGGGVALTYRLYRSSTQGGYTIGTPFTTTTATSIACSSVVSGAGPWYITVTAVQDASGDESVFANELSPPAAPGIGAH